MASNEIPDKPYDIVFALAEDMADGAQANGAAVGLLQNTEAAIRADLAAATAAEATFQAARAAKKTLSTAFQIADSNAKAFLAAVKKVLSITLGDQWSAAWAATGWVGPSLRLPANADERLGMLPGIKAYLTANPAFENAPLGVTATAAQAQIDALSAARTAVNDGNKAAGEKKALRETALDALRQRMIGLVRELTQLLEDDDARWYAFGLNRPGDPSTPAVPASLVLTVGGPGLVLADWADARRAERYKVQKQIVGTDADWIETTQVTDSETTLANLPVGATVKVRILAANQAGDSLPSDPAQIVIA